MSQLAKLSPITLIQGNSVEILKQFPDDTVDCVLTDPPYLSLHRNNWIPKSRSEWLFRGSNYEHRGKVEQILIECRRILRNNTAIYVFSDDTNLDFYLSVIKEHFQFKNVLVWKKNNWSSGDLRYSYGKQCEFIVYANKGKRKLNEIGGHQRHISILEYPRIPPKQRLYPFQKPLNLITWFLMVSTDAGDIVLDPFMGSATVGEACQNLNRQFIGIDNDADTFDIACARLPEAEIIKDFTEKPSFTKQ